MSLATRISGLTVVPVAVVGLTQFHYVISHISQIATGAAAITAGVAIWSGNAMIGKAKLRKEEKAAKAQQSAPSLDDQVSAYLAANESQYVLPQSSQTNLDERLADMRRRAQVIDYSTGQAVAKRV